MFNFSFVFFCRWQHDHVQSKACCAVNECCIRQYEVPVWITLDTKKSILINNMVRSRMPITSMVDHCMETLQNQHNYLIIIISNIYISLRSINIMRHAFLSVCERSISLPSEKRESSR